MAIGIELVYALLQRLIWRRF